MTILDLAPGCARVRPDWDRPDWDWPDGDRPDGETIHVGHPLRGTIAVRGTWTADGVATVCAPDARDPHFPQLDVSSGPDWAVWPVWRLLPRARDHGGDIGPVRFAGRGAEALAGDPVGVGEDDGLIWAGAGLMRRSLTLGRLAVVVEHPPGLEWAVPLARDALRALQAWAGVLPWRAARILVEPLPPGIGRDKGLAHPRAETVWCRAMFRPDGTGTRPRDRAAAAELIVHELLHHVLEVDTPPGHLLTEGLITYLARVLVVRAGLAPAAWLAASLAAAGRELAAEPARGLSLTEASARFFASEPARRVAYRKGVLAMAAIDAATGGRLPAICRSLAARARRERRLLREREVVARLPAGAARCYAAALTSTGTGPGTGRAGAGWRRGRS